MTNEQLIREAEKAIDEVFSDTSVSQSVTRQSLKGLADYIRESLSTLKADDD